MKEVEKMYMLAQNLKKLREEKKITQKALGENIGIKEKAYQKYEYGYSIPPIQQMCDLANYFDTTIEYLMYGKNDKNIYSKKVIPFHERLIELRNANHLTQKQLADKLGVHEANYQKYEYGEHTPRIERIIQLAELFQVPIDDMMGRVRK